MQHNQIKYYFKQIIFNIIFLSNQTAVAIGELYPEETLLLTPPLAPEVAERQKPLLKA